MCVFFCFSTFSKFYIQSLQCRNTNTELMHLKLHMMLARTLSALLIATSRINTKTEREREKIERERKRERESDGTNSSYSFRLCKES